MTKCWIHENLGIEEEKSPKPLKETPLWPDRTKDYQQNLAILFSPSQKELDFEALTEEKDELFKKKQLQTKEINSFLNKWKVNTFSQLNTSIETISQERDDWKTAWKEVQQDGKEQITKLNQEITQKDDRNAQLDKLFKGTAVIFQKQHNFVDHLKQKLQKEQKEKGISEEKSKHLQTNIEHLDQQKEELDQRIKELQAEEIKNKTVRDQEIAELKAKVAKQAQTIKDLTEVKMKREESEERLRKQSEEFLKVQEMNKVVYDILGQFSTATGLLPRTQEVVNLLKQETLNEQEKEALKDADKFLEIINTSGIITIDKLLLVWKSYPNLIFTNLTGSRLRNLSFLVYILVRDLDRDRNWWDKWINDNSTWVKNHSIDSIELTYPNSSGKIISIPSSQSLLKRQIKENFYQYYRDR